MFHLPPHGVSLQDLNVFKEKMKVFYCANPNKKWGIGGIMTIHRWTHVPISNMGKPLYKVSSYFMPIDLLPWVPYHLNK